MTRRRAFTIMEMMLAVSLMAVIVGAVTAIYAYAIERMGYGVADASTQREAEYGIDVIDGIVSKAQTCSNVSVVGVQCLKCVMPANCVDSTGDGMLDTCSPNAINRRGQERWGQGRRVWFYLADSTGVPATQGTILWMAMRSDDLTPTAADVVNAYTYYPGNTLLRLDLIQSMTASPGEASNDYNVNISTGSNSLSGGGSPANGGGTASTYQLTLSRKPYMHGWRL